MAINTGNFPQDLRPGIRMWFGNAYKNFETKYDKLLDVKVPDDRAYEEDVTMSNLGLAVVKTQGAPVVYDSANQMYTTRYTHVQYGLGFSITQEMMEDGIALKMGQVFSESLKDGMLRGREIAVHSLYNNAFNNTLMDGGDGVGLGSSAHPTAGGNQSNVPLTPGTLAESTIEQAVIDLAAYKDNRGILISVNAEKLIIHPNNMFTARRILGSVLRSGSADNDINALKDMGVLSSDNVIVSPYLTSTTNWHVRTSVPGLNFFNRKDITLSDDNEFDTENAKFKGLMRFSYGWSDWRSYYGVNA